MKKKIIQKRIAKRLQNEKKEHKEYEVEKILDEKEEKGKKFYLIKWKNYRK